MFLNDDADVAFSVFARTQNMKYGQLACFVLDDGGRDIPLVLDGCTIDTQDDVVIFQSLYVPLYLFFYFIYKSKLCSAQLELKKTI